MLERFDGSQPDDARDATFQKIGLLRLIDR
jgi:hypothetical protein